ncbi:MAG TPA: transcriptional repressor LexA [Candidatus Limnocylindria bacterium]|nr:transcriptional repressor LexA [Candidatus Limnocylindria bacterium]
MLTRRQKQVLDFIRSHTRTRGYAPTLAEIRRHLGLGSVATVHKHVRQLEEKGAVRRLPHRSRALEVCDVAPARAARVRLLGTVAAGTPIEPIEIEEVVAVPEELLGRGETFALRVRGNSMIDDGIYDGDVVLVERRSSAPDGATVVAVVRGEATVKRLARRRGKVYLLPANTTVQPIVARPDDVEIRGVVVALLRRYR